MRTLPLLLLALAAACGGAPPAPSASVPPLLRPRELTEQAPESFRVRFRTTKGEFVVEAVRAWAPRGVDRLWNMVKAGYYDRTPFYRVKKGFMAQFGFHKDPEVNDAWRNAIISDDPPGGQRNLRGMVSFGQMGVPNSRSVHLFVNYVHNDHLDAAFPPVGRVAEGMEVVDAIHGGYGEGPDQRAIERHGLPFLEKGYPELDYVLSASIEN